jgi:hypothetical protein
MKPVLLVGIPESIADAASADGTVVVSVFKPRSRPVRITVVLVVAAIAVGKCRS